VGGGLQARHFRIEPDITVAAWLDGNQTPSRQRRLLWEPLCIAALNTPAERASAQVLANVLRDSLAGTREASDMLLPQVDLTALFPEPAAKFIAERGGAVHAGHRVDLLEAEGKAWRIDGAGPFAQVVVAVAPYHLGGLVPELASRVADLDWEPIVTSYFSYEDWVRLPQPMLGVDAGLAQWLFDRGALCGQYGLIAAVISARGRHLDLPTAELERGIHREIARLVRELPAPLSVQTITEKRATFACVPNLQRPPARTELPGLWLAGDYVAGAEVKTPYLRGRDVYVVRAGKVVVVRGAKEPEAVRQGLKDAFPVYHPVLLALRLQQREDQVLLAHAGR